MFQKDKEDVESVSPKEKETTDLGSTYLNSPIEIAKDTDAQTITVPNPNIEPEPLLSTEVTKTQEQPQAIEVLPIVSQELIAEKTPMASPSSINEVNPDLICTPNSNLDLMLSKAKSYSESYSKSVSEFSKSLTPPSFYQLSEETKDEVKSFFRMLELPLAEIATDHTPPFTSCVNHLIAKKVLSESEHIRLEEFWSSLSENLTVVAYCQKEMKEKLDTINQFANVSGKLDVMGNTIYQLKDRLHQLDVEEAELIARLGKLREERRSLLAQKELINHELANINHDEHGIKAMVSMAIVDFLKNQERYNVIDNGWSYFFFF